MTVAARVYRERIAGQGWPRAWWAVSEGRNGSIHLKARKRAKIILRTRSLGSSVTLARSLWETGSRRRSWPSRRRVLRSKSCAPAPGLRATVRDQHQVHACMQQGSVTIPPYARAADRAAAGQALHRDANTAGSPHASPLDSPVAGPRRDRHLIFICVAKGSALPRTCICVTGR